ncbi:MAG: D-isomer specific 2-hydroxyacid dehydrogenase family protein [Acidimicrobiales bacterium]
MADAVRAGGGEVVPVAQAEALVWTETSEPAALNRLLRDNAGIRWVQLPWAGIEPYLGVLDHDRVWTNGKGVYAEPVAEHALALLLAGFRGIVTYARRDHWSEQQGTNLTGAKVVVLGGGGITVSLLRLLEPFEADVTVVRRKVEPLPGATRVVARDDLDDAVTGADGVVVALALTPETRGIIARPQLERMSPRGWLVNVARGQHVVTDDLVAVLRDEAIGGVALDVTDPEPLPSDHPLWTMPNALITPHVGNTMEMAVPLLTRRIAENVRRFAAGEDLIGVVDPDLGY